MLNRSNFKSPYCKPQLRLYGDIKTLTQNVADIEGSADGAGMDVVPNKTN
ncbi:MAG: hypothetical protein AAGA60_12915 [Cyanobacteria bacterium P01_E01_bin.42]